MIGCAKDWVASARFAASEGELLRLANDFVATWSRDQLASLPKDCRVPRIESLESLGDLAFALVRHECTLEPVDHPAILQAMARFFASASTRGAELRARSRGLRLIGIPSIATSRR